MIAAGDHIRFRCMCVCRRMTSGASDGKKTQQVTGRPIGKRTKIHLVNEQVVRKDGKLSAAEARKRADQSGVREG